MAEKSAIKDMTFTIFDTETTGLDPSTDRIIEIAAVRVKGGRRLGTFQSLVDPAMPVPSMASRINGITDEMLVGQPAMAEVIPKFGEFIRGSVLCAYNAPFDMGFLGAEYCRAGLALPADLAVVDVLSMARNLLDIERHPLAAVAGHLGIGEGQEHRALSDVELTLGVFRALVKLLDDRDIISIDDFVCLFGRGCGRFASMQEAKLSQIQRAIDQGASIRIRYFSRSDSRLSEREVLPRLIKTERNRAYVTGYCCLKNGERTFSVENILQLEMLGPAGGEGRMKGTAG